MSCFTHEFRVKKERWREGKQIDKDRIYTDEELEFLKAIDRYKRVNRKPYPSWREVFMVLKSLGYEKVKALDEKEVNISAEGSR